MLQPRESGRASARGKEQGPARDGAGGGRSLGKGMDVADAPLCTDRAGEAIPAPEESALFWGQLRASREALSKRDAIGCTGSQVTQVNYNTPTLVGLRGSEEGPAIGSSP